MKKLFVILILVMSGLMLKAAGKVTSYVTVGGKTFFCEQVKQGLFNMNLTMDDGSIMKVPIKKVDSYSCGGRMFERLPVICKDAPANCTALMEFITSRNGFRLYKHSEYRECGDLWNNNYKTAHLQVEYYVYKDGKLHFKVTKDNIESVMPFFGLKAV